LKINDLQVKKPYEISKSKYQFLIGDRIYLFDRNTLVIQGDGEMHEIELVGGRKGFAVTGTDGGFLALDEKMHPDEFREITEDTNGIRDDIDMRSFLEFYDETEFVPAENMSLLINDRITKLVDQNYR